MKIIAIFKYSVQEPTIVIQGGFITEETNVLKEGVSLVTGCDKQVGIFDHAHYFTMGILCLEMSYQYIYNHYHKHVHVIM